MLVKLLPNHVQIIIKIILLSARHRVKILLTYNLYKKNVSLLRN